MQFKLNSRDIHILSRSLENHARAVGIAQWECVYLHVGGPGLNP